MAEGQRLKCSGCGAELAANATGGHCLACLLQLGLVPDELAPAEMLSTEEPFQRAGLGVGPDPAVHRIIGNYKLLQKIGEGGCGVVYMAEQEQPVRRRVALKVIKLGMDTRQVIARFEAERQALALMDHPNIAKVLEAGATGTGRPYFVMELVRGIRITDYCDQHQLDTTQRLQLFIQICHAIQHAHQKGIIHRDIKPSNILVTLHDEEPVPKVIDFGIAKATAGRLTDHTLFTAFEQFVGTPAYMSPEQAALTDLDIDTRSDIYSLGVLLYELLTGITPFDTKTLLAAGLDEMRRTIREKEPLRPSKVLETLGQLPTQPDPARASPRGPILNARPKSFSTDLDWIVMKCLEKDRARRYETANGLSRDIQRHLNCQPVVARPPSRLYEFQKSFRRHKFGFTASIAVLAALLVGATASTWLYFKEKQARQLADAEARKNLQVADFFRRALSVVHPGGAFGGAEAVRHILDEAARLLPSGFTNQAGVEMELRTSLIEDNENLGRWQEAADLAQQNVQVARRELSPNHPALAVALAQLGREQWQLGDQAGAEDSIDQALDLHGKGLWSGNLQQSEQALDNLVGILLPLRQAKLDEQVLVQLLTPAVKLYPNEAKIFTVRGSFFARRGQWQRAAIDLRRAVELDPQNSEFYHALAPVLVAEGDLASYRQLCAGILVRFANATDPSIADRMAKDCLILPSSGVDLSSVRQMADIAMTSGHPYGLLCKGLAEYRLGRFASAQNWMNRVLAHPDRNPVRDVETYAVLAMARWELHQRAEARLALAHAARTAGARLPKLDSGGLDGSWIDWIIGHTLLGEAESHIQEGASKTVGAGPLFR
ncbi:MAG TPA: serine/threonine-protein kinase [Verrucomicrobiae bacterium]|nr:serine/threonine-protein kinase [Verrucomicrobiae bacterium]